MKKQKKNLLKLEKETISVLNKEQLIGVKGGEEFTSLPCLKGIYHIATITAPIVIAIADAIESGRHQPSDNVDVNGYCLISNIDVY
ncbi:MAG: class I lanthipeptide [Bacteroidales bacterium]|jgi:hypothetical protein|nr:class I lanthipeptide [Bacteroidales bacterium]